MKTNKYHAIKTTRKGIVFDSKFEADVFEVLNNATYQHDLIYVIVKPSILYKPTSNTFESRFWKCDFQIELLDNEWLNIEAKGLAFPIFRSQMEMLEMFNPAQFSRTRIIMSDMANVKPWMKGMVEAGMVWTIQQLAEQITLPKG
jgi:hypothetical protein